MLVSRSGDRPIDVGKITGAAFVPGPDLGWGVCGCLAQSGHSSLVLVSRGRDSLVAHQRAVLVQLADAGATKPEVVAHDPLIVLPQTRRSKIAEETSDEILRDPDVRKRMQEELQKQVEMWVHEKIPILGGRTPTQAVGDPEGREIVESLLLQWERHTRENNDPRDIRPDVGALRWMLNLPSSAS